MVHASDTASGTITGINHTPGPWRLDGGVVRGVSRETGNERPICEIYRELQSSAETLANAELIASVPNMVSLLRAARNELMMLGDPGSTAEDIVDRIGLLLAAASS